jgi:predicted amino acid racemase
VFLNSLVRRNPQFVQAAIELHRDGLIPPNSYVLDLDAIRENARLIGEEAHRLGLTVLAMSKQIARNPPALDALVEGGADAFVAVDMGCVLPIAQTGHQIGNIGHVVQIPQREAPRASAANPSFWTVYSFDKAAEAAHAAVQQGREQRLLIRVHGPGDTFPPGLEGGFPADTIGQVVDAIDRLEGASFGGITTYPAIRYNEAADAIEPAPNARTLERVAGRLSELGIERFEINAPGMTSFSVLELLASLGASQVEPGHGFTATTPLHAHHDLPERPASLYLTEVSHEHDGKAYCFGGGLYVCPVFSDYRRQALVGRDPEQALAHRMDVTLMPPDAIDYYAMLEGDGEPPATGDTVIFGHRIQAFVTRAFVVPISGVASEQPAVQGIWSAAGTPVSWPGYVGDYLSGNAVTDSAA